MMRRPVYVGFLATAVLSCGTVPTPITLPAETEFSLINLSRRWYATIGLRPAEEWDPAEQPFVQSKLIPPGAVYRERFFDLFPQTGGCPERLDLRVYLFKRINEDVPIGLDPGEPLNPQAVASAEILDVVACERVVVSTFTIVLRDSSEGTGVLKIAQETEASQDITFTGQNLSPLESLPEMLENAPLAGQVVTPDGTAILGIGVLLRTRYRVTDDDTALCPEEPDGRCYSLPIAIRTTDEQGRFSFDRPPGAYRVEVFADGFLFRPVSVIVESPIDNIIFVAEPE